VGLALSPGLLATLSVDRTVVLVSGTNGKTTTSAMIATGWSEDVATNNTGSNMPAGHVAALIASSSPLVVLEVDEGWLATVARATKPRVIALLNLSRDQLDRANEVRQMAERWRDVLAALPETTVVANANDPLVVYAAEGASKVAWCDVPTPWTSDAISCPRCTKPLHFEATTWWSECGFSKPSSVVTTLRDGLEVNGVELELRLSMPGDFNRVNAALALTVLSVLGIDEVNAVTRIDALTTVAGRFSLRRWRGQTLRLMLAKNPAGFAALLETVPRDDADVWVAINARVADGHDPSWLYDVPFELLRGHRVYCFGDRQLDLATRLEYAGVDFVVATDSMAPTLSTAPTALLANYTAFQEWRARSVEC
jgi:UDP-N-acetylmuramyl tripeptide synthase